MTTASNHSIKSKVTVSLNADLVKTLDKLLPKGHSRSQIMEKALSQWINEYTRQKMEEEVEEYYLSLSESEKEEDQKWNHIASESAIGIWQKE